MNWIISISVKQFLDMHAQLSSREISLYICLYFLSIISEDSDEFALCAHGKSPKFHELDQLAHRNMI